MGWTHLHLRLGIDNGAVDERNGKGGTKALWPWGSCLNKNEKHWKMCRKTLAIFFTKKKVQLNSNEGYRPTQRALGLRPDLINGHT